MSSLLIFKLINNLEIRRVPRGRGSEARWSSQKWPPSLQICRMTSRPRETVSQPQWRQQASSRHCLHLNYLAFISTKNRFFKNSQHDNKVQNDTLTICIKKCILIEIKASILFLNFTNSLNCEEIFQFCIKINKCYIILHGFHERIKLYQRQFTKPSSFWEILVFLLLLYALE